MRMMNCKELDRVCDKLGPVWS